MSTPDTHRPIRRHHPAPPDALLRQWYLTERQPMSQLGEPFGVDVKTVARWLREAGIAVRSPSAARRIAAGDMVDSDADSLSGWIRPGDTVLNAVTGDRAQVVSVDGVMLLLRSASGECEWTAAATAWEAVHPDTPPLPAAPKGRSRR